MSTIRIGNDPRELDDADPQWITQEINGRRRDGQNVCVVVQIQTEDLSLSLRTPSCGGGGGAGRPPTVREQAVIDLWKEHGLDGSDFSAGDVIAFLKRLRKFL